ncbi:helix-turn-helix domain-containing protein [Halovenus sp. HT40]|uniref:helix-turn-helix domain-containing protein n=1 Tax=Halovenus sp. HT40 TaxID=3126691 RepID=UPI00300F640D
MRYAEVRLDPGPEGFHPADRKLTDSDHIQRIAIHHVNQLDDGTVVLLYELQGIRSRAREVLDANDDVLAYSIAPGAEPDSARGQSNGLPRRQTLHTYIHIDPNETLVSVFQLPQEYSLVIETPIECLPGGGITVLVMGDQQTITNAVGVLPDRIETELLATGEYHPTERTLYSQLTPRQQEILATAVEAGYYNVPKAVTHEGLADRLDLAPVTVGEHLRKIEARVFAEIVP